MKKKFYLAPVVILSSFLIFFACGKKRPKLTDQSSISGSKTEPAWVTRCAGAFEDAGKEAFYGCGVASGIENRALQIQTADARARADLARAIDTYIASFFKDYLSSAGLSQEAGLTEIEEKQFIESITKEITEVSLYGVQILDRWRAPDGTLYSLARVSFENVAQNMKKAMSERAKELKLEADRALEELDRQLEKRKQSGK